MAPRAAPTSSRRRRPGRIVILTSGTTGTPKGAQRGMPESLDPMAALLSKIPLHAREPTMIAAPLFHSWGMAHFSLALALSSTMVLRRRFDPEATLAATAQHRCHGARRRAGDAPAHPRAARARSIARYDLSALRVIAASGSALPGELALRVMDRFGDVLYNLYGSTEVAWATIATPEDLPRRPGTAGRPPRGTVVRIVDDAGREVPPGRDGPHLRRQRDGLRGLHRRRRQGGRRRPALHGRRGPPRPRRAPVRRRPRRRDDRLGRRERLPARGRGRPGRPRGRPGGRGRRRPGRAVRPAPAGVRRACRRPRARRRRAQGPRQAHAGRLQGAARRRVPAGAAAQRHWQGAQARLAARP